MFVICIKDRLLDRHLCLNLYPCVIKVQSVSQSVPAGVKRNRHAGDRHCTGTDPEILMICNIFLLAAVITINTETFDSEYLAENLPSPVDTLSSLFGLPSNTEVLPCWQ